MLAKRKVRAPSEAPKPVPSGDLELAGSEITESYKVIEEAWKKAEAKLLLSHVPETAKVLVDTFCIGPEFSPQGEGKTYLAFAKLNNKWRICLIEEEFIYEDQQFGDGVSVKRTPITEASLAMRLKMIDWFPKLADEVVRVTRSYVPKIKEKAALLEAKLEVMDL